MPKLRVKYEYIKQNTIYPAGQVIEVSNEQARWLMDDAPGCFEIVTDTPPVTRDLEAAPADKMIHKAKRK